MLLLLVALGTPFAIMLTVLGPVYAGILGAAYLIYLPSGDAAHPLATHLDDVFYITDVYGQLWSYWLQHPTDTAFLGYTLPLLGLPLLGLLVAVFLVRRLIRKLINLFHMASSA